MKITYEFKKMDAVDCSGCTEEEIQAVLDRMVECGATLCAGYGGFHKSYPYLTYDHEGDSYFYNYSEDLNIIPWSDIESTITNQDSSLSEETTSIPPVIEWKCFKEVASVLGEEDAEYALDRVRLKALDDGAESISLNTNRWLRKAFVWYHTQQGYAFWDNIATKLMSVDDCELSSYVFTEGVPSSSTETIGTLIEKLYTQLPPSGVQIVISESGIYLSGERTPTLNISKLEPEDIDKAYEVLVECEGLWMDFNDECDSDL